MKTPKIYTGQKVQHITGGPVMVVYRIDFGKKGWFDETFTVVYCSWWDGKDFNHQSFMPEELRGDGPQ